MGYGGTILIPQSPHGDIRTLDSVKNMYAENILSDSTKRKRDVKIICKYL